MNNSCTPLHVLIACECSQVETTAFRAAGAIAWSCDIKRCSGGHPEWHIQGDVTPLLRGQRYFYTQDGRLHHSPPFDLIIAHPPCTYLCRLGAVNLYKNGVLDELRHAQGIVARHFFQLCIDASAKYVAVENPIPLRRYNLPPYQQKLQPYEFGHNVSKATLLWLKNLPPLMATGITRCEESWVKKTRLQTTRSRAFEGIANAMAEQWTQYIINNEKKQK